MNEEQAVLIIELLEKLNNNVEAIREALSDEGEISIFDPVFDTRQESAAVRELVRGG